MVSPLLVWPNTETASCRHHHATRPRLNPRSRACVRRDGAPSRRPASSNPTPPPDTGDATPVAGARAATSAPPETAQRLQARDVVAFGHEVGRALSDGRIVGRAETLRQGLRLQPPRQAAVGATAWVILEDVALDATIDNRGRLVADTPSVSTRW